MTVGGVNKITLNAAEHRGAGLGNGRIGRLAARLLAQPPFSMKELCCQELTFFNSKRFAAASAPS
jgi:hypothetical protein